MAKLKGLNPDWMDTSKSMPVTKTDHITRKFENLSYGDADSLQSLDIYLPETGKGPFPVIINVHGGGWVSCDKHDFHLYPTLYALEQGFAVAAVNYRLSPAVRYPAQVYDVKQAIRWISNNSETYRLDADNLFLWGTSAGGNLVLMCGLKKGLELPPELESANQIPIRGVAALCPAIDMAGLSGAGQWWEKVMVWMLFRNMLPKVLGSRNPTLEQLRNTNPTTFIHDGMAPLYLQHGGLDPAVPVEQSIEFGRAASDVLAKEDYRLDIMPGVKHAGAGPDYFLPEHINPIFDFFKNHIKTGKI